MARPAWVLACALVAAGAVGAVGCGGPSSRDDQVIADAGAPVDCGDAAPATADSGACTSGATSFERRSREDQDDQREREALDLQSCAACLVGHAPIAQLCGDVAPDQLERAATACGAASYAALGSSGLVCARSLAWATVYGPSTVGNALGVGAACSAARATGADQAACLGTLQAVVAAEGYALSLIDLLRDCSMAIGPACVLARDYRDSVRIAAAALAVFGSALPPEIASRSVLDWIPTIALSPATDGLLRGRFAGASVGAALASIAAELQARSDALSSSIEIACF